MGGACSKHGRDGNAYGKPDGKRPQSRLRHRWENNIRMKLREIGWEGTEWMHLA